jgi:hypothetical protein
LMQCKNALLGVSLIAHQLPVISAFISFDEYQ